jgi:hypothetical protein
VLACAFALIAGNGLAPTSFGRRMPRWGAILRNLPRNKSGCHLLSWPGNLGVRRLQYVSTFFAHTIAAYPKLSRVGAEPAAPRRGFGKKPRTSTTLTE